MAARLILGSSSPRRIELLRQFPMPFEVIPSAAEELHDENLSAANLCVTNALRKANQVANLHRTSIVLGADTLVTLNGRHFGKPKNLQQAEAMLEALSGRTHQVITGVALLHLEADRQEAFAEETQVTFQTLTSERIREYIRLVPVLDKAGAYAIQNRGEMIVAGIQGSLSNVIGLPVERLAETFLAWNLITRHECDKILASQKTPGLRN